MKQQFNFRLDTKLKDRVQRYAENQEPEETIARIIHKALYEYLDKHKK